MTLQSNRDAFKADFEAGKEAVLSKLFTPVLLTSVAFASLIQPTFAAADNHAAYLASVSTYKQMVGFKHVVGPTRFIGYFLKGPDGCRVTVFTSAADDEAFVAPPKVVEINIVAAGRAELPAGDGSALAIACTADADLIKIAPQHPSKVADKP